MEATSPPGFIVIGTMKSGTTTLFRWLQEASGSDLCKVKEPQFFSHNDVWRRGFDWYRGLFPDQGHSGEASPSYTHPDLAEASARRIDETIPQVKLVALLRDPTERLRSHYRHQVQRGRERRDFLEAVGDVDSIYVRQSRYDLVLAPYLERFPREHLLILQSEALFGEDPATWQRLLGFLELSPADRPTETHNVTAGKDSYSRLMRSLYDRGIAQRLEKVTPRALKSAVRPLFLKSDDDRYRELTNQSRTEQLPDEELDLFSESRRVLSALQGFDTSLWRSPS
jgi:hypothetical protein